MEDLISTQEEDDSTVDLDNGQRSGEEKRCQYCYEIIPRKILIECDRCGNKYHRSCVGVRRRVAEQISIFHCPSCRIPNLPNQEPPNGADQTNHDFDFLQHLTRCKSNISLLGNIPRGARIMAAEALTELIDNVIRTNSSLAWMKLLCFTFHALQKPKKEKSTSNSPSLVTKIKNQISVFMNSPFPPSRISVPTTKEE